MQDGRRCVGEPKRKSMDCISSVEGKMGNGPLPVELAFQG